MDALLIAGVTFVLGIATNWTATRRTLALQYDTELRRARLEAYGKLWAQLETLNKYGRASSRLSRVDTENLVTALKHWYFRDGGIYLSEPHARRRHAQDPEAARRAHPCAARLRARRCLAGRRAHKAHAVAETRDPARQLDHPLSSGHQRAVRAGRREVVEHALGQRGMGDLGRPYRERRGPSASTPARTESARRRATGLDAGVRGVAADALVPRRLGGRSPSNCMYQRGPPRASFSQWPAS